MDDLFGVLAGAARTPGFDRLCGILCGHTCGHLCLSGWRGVWLAYGAAILAGCSCGMPHRCGTPDWLMPRHIPLSGGVQC
eukprot:365105-Chlamydomonas_euryale.AAC.5